MIFVRAVLKWSTIWQTDFVVYARTAAIFLGAAYVLSHKGHVGVDFVQSGLKGGGRHAVDRFAMAAGFLFCAVMACELELFPRGADRGLANGNGVGHSAVDTDAAVALGVRSAVSPVHC